MTTVIIDGDAGGRFFLRDHQGQRLIVINFNSDWAVGGGFGEPGGAFPAYPTIIGG